MFLLCFFFFFFKQKPEYELRISDWSSDVCSSDLMVSTVRARLLPGLSPVDVLRVLFPCGSITGAPKVRAMEIIDAVEPFARGVYTGSMGWIDPSGDAAFNVAIRTICVEEGSREGRLGLGSGIVADSDVASEWAECLAKGRFLAPA